MRINPRPLVESLEALGMDWSNPGDWLRLDCVADFYFITIVRQRTGTTERLFLRSTGSGSGEITTFDPQTLTRAARNQFIRSLHMQKVSQRQIAEMLGLTQQAISHICRSLAASKRPLPAKDPGGQCGENCGEQHG